MNKKVYNANGMNLKLATVWRVKPIEAYESCQVRKEAAISSNFCVDFTFHRVTNKKLNFIQFY